MKKRTYPGGLNSSNEELAPIGVWAGIGHTEVKGTLMLELKVLISKLLAIDTFTTTPISVSKISTL
jgi:hypothetical protein